MDSKPLLFNRGAQSDLRQTPLILSLEYNKISNIVDLGDAESFGQLKVLGMPSARQASFRNRCSRLDAVGEVARDWRRRKRWKGET